MEKAVSETSSTIDDQKERFKRWYVKTGRAQTSANQYATSLLRTKLKGGQAIFEITDYEELFGPISEAGLEDYFQTRGSDYSKMEAVLEIATDEQLDDLKGGIKFYLEFLKAQNQVKMTTDSNQDEMPKNLILYGAPGTGKTYSSIQYAVSILEEKPIKEIKGEDYKEVFDRFKKYKDDGLVQFTTFHQSFSYEEFIEGIRPVLQSEDSSELTREIEYEVHSGLFKEFCNSAVRGNAFSNEDIFEKAWDELISAAKENGNQCIFTRRTGTEIIAHLVSDTTFRVNWNSVQGSYNSITMSSTLRQWLYPIERSIISGGNRWLFDARQAVIDELTSKYNLGYIGVEKTSRNRVFIIDEINRGNISKIFGELITLIEPSKRLGAQEELRATLPYSGQSFGVPNNVYIIGTMNTADRSIALIDTALRRRFSFVEVAPNPATLNGVKVEGIDLEKLLDTLNKRIAALYDRDHMIGHSFLLPLKEEPSLEKLASIFENQIIPLLQEYFYDDHEKIQLVLGDNQKDDDATQFIVKNLDTAGLFGSADLDNSESYQVNHSAFRNTDAYAYLQ